MKIADCVISLEGMCCTRSLLHAPSVVQYSARDETTLHTWSPWKASVTVVVTITNGSLGEGRASSQQECGCLESLRLQYEPLVLRSVPFYRKASPVAETITLWN